MSLTVLRAGLDTLEESYSGHFDEDAIVRLDRAKSEAIARSAAVPIDSGLTELFVQPKAFGLWRWRLTEPRFSIVGKPNAGMGHAVAQVRYSAFGLCNEDLSTLVLLARGALASLGSFLPLAVSRADVCVDFQGWAPSEADMRCVVCPAEYRATHGTEKQTQTYVFGKKKLLRVYNKTQEIAVSKKYWLYDLWKQNPGYDPDAEVWRVEFQGDSNVTRELGMRSVEQLVENPGAYLDYGLRWAQLRVPGNDATKTRWEEDSRWKELRAAVFEGEPLRRHVRVPELMSLDSTARRLVGLAATAGAYFGTDNFIHALQMLSMSTEVHMMEEGIDFASVVEEKRRRVLSEGV